MKRSKVTKSSAITCAAFRRGYAGIIAQGRDRSVSDEELIPIARPFGNHRRKCRSCNTWAESREKD